MAPSLINSGDCATDPSSSFDVVLSHVLQKGKGQQRSRDPRSVRLAAVTSALVESANELRGENEGGVGGSAAGTTSAAEVFTAGLAALSATVASEDASTRSSPQLPLLELLALTIPHVPAGLYLNQFGLLSRSLRGVAASALADDAGGEGETRDELGGVNATVRASARCATSALLRVASIDAGGTGTTAPVGEKETLKLYGGTVLNLFDDRRAKVRRAAHGATVELSMLRGGGGVGAGKGKGKLAGAIPSHVVEYSHAVLSSFLEGTGRGANKGEASDRAVRVMHLLHLLSDLFPALTDAQRVRLGEDVVKLALNLLGGGTGRDAEDGKRLGGQQGILLANASLSALLVVLESEPSPDGREPAAGNNAVDQFAARVLASLLSNNGGQPDIGAGDDGGGAASDAGGECLVLYGRAVVAASSRLFRGGEEQGKVGAKLLPLSISCVLGLADRHNSTEVARSVSSELTRLIRTGMPSPLSRLADAEGTKCARGCVAAVEKVLHHRFRSTWSVTLSPLATAIELTANSIIGNDESRNSIDGDQGSEGTAEMKMIQDLVGGALNALVRLHEDVNDGPSRSAVEGAVGAVVGGIGVEVFWDLVSLTEYGAGGAGGPKKKKRKQGIEGGVSTNRAWLLPILKSSSLSSSSPRRLRLAFFQRNILGLARSCDAASAGGKLTAVESSIQKSRVVDLWSLFPSFCVNPSDIELTFPTLAQILVRAMGDVRYPQLVSIICIGLKMLASGVSQRAAESGEFIESNDPETDQLQADAKVLSEVSVKLLPALFKTVEILHNTGGKTKKEAEDDMNVEDGTDDPTAEKKALATQDAQRAHAVTEAIGEFARLAPRPFLMTLFKKIMQRLLAATQAEDDETEKICTLLGLAQALVTSLDEGGVSLLYRAVKPLIRSDEYDSRVQKRAYKVMVEICERHTAFVTAPERLDEMTELMVGSLMTCQVSARHMRLKCMLHMVKGFDSSHSRQMDVIPKIMGEVLLCLKDSNAKTREAAYQLLLAMAVARNDMTDFFQIVLAALGAQTPHMRSAAVMALSRLVFEYSREDESVQALLPSLLQTVIVLFDENSREVIKSVVAFVRVSVAALGSDQLEPLLPEVIGGLMKYNKGKGRFRAKIKIILKKLVRTYGYEKITPLVPEGDARLITHMRKLAERDARRKAENHESGRVAGRGNDFDEMMESDEDDSDGGRTLMTGATGFTRMTARSGSSIRSAAMERSERAKSVRSIAQSAASNRTAGRGGAGAAAPRIRAEKNGDVLDMLDPSMAKSVHFADERADNEFSDDDDDAGGVMEFDDAGKLVIHDDMDGGAQETSERAGDGDDGADGENKEIRGGGKRRRISKFESAKVKRAEASALENKKKRKKSNEPKALGAAFKSKRAGGDLKKKGQKYEPYAYVPLDGKSYTKKNRSKAVAQMSTVVRDKGGKRKRR